MTPVARNSFKSPLLLATSLVVAFLLAWYSGREPDVQPGPPAPELMAPPTRAPSESSQPSALSSGNAVATSTAARAFEAGPSVTSSVRATATASTGSDAGVPEELRRSLSEESERLADRWAEEPVDAVWTDEAKSRLAQVIEEFELPADLETVDCRETLCRIDVAVDDMIAANALLTNARRKDEPLHIALMPNPGEGLPASVYIGRPGVKL